MELIKKLLHLDRINMAHVEHRVSQDEQTVNAIKDSTASHAGQVSASIKTSGKIQKDITYRIALAAGVIQPRRR